MTCESCTLFKFWEYLNYFLRMFSKFITAERQLIYLFRKLVVNSISDVGSSKC